MIADADLVEGAAAPREPGGDLGIEAEAVLLQLDCLDDLAPEDLVAGLHVGEVEVGEAVGQQGQQPVGDHVPEKQHPVRVAAGEARAVDHVGVVLEDRRDQPRVVGRVVFQVGVLDDDDVAGRRRDASACRSTLAAVVRLEDGAVDAVGERAAQQLDAAVGRAVVDHDDLKPRHGGAADPGDQLGDRGGLVEAGDDDRKPVALAVDRQAWIHEADEGRRQGGRRTRRFEHRSERATMPDPLVRCSVAGAAALKNS